jgi:hypothetical protein
VRALMVQAVEKHGQRGAEVCEHPLVLLCLVLWV